MRPSAATTSAARPGPPSFSARALAASACAGGSGAAPLQAIPGAAIRKRGPGSILTTAWGLSPVPMSGVTE